MRLWALLVLAYAVIAVPLTAVVAQQPGGVPERLRTTLDAAPAGSVVLNDHTLSGWLLWREPQLVSVLDLIQIPLISTEGLAWFSSPTGYGSSAGSCYMLSLQEYNKYIIIKKGGTHLCIIIG